MIEVNNISKKYGTITAIENFNFTVAEGELFGCIGPDGAGKTSLFRILTSLLLPTQGYANVCGFNTVSQYKQLRQHIGYMPSKFSLYLDLSVEENLNFYATIFNTSIKQNYDLIKDIYSHIEPFKTRLASQLSGGMKQKLALSCALIHKPKVLILDEPTFGVDAVSRKEFWVMLKNLQSKGITIIVSTPYMDEAALCNHVALIQKGKIMDIDSPNEIIKKFAEPLWAIKTDNMYKLKLDIIEYNMCNSAYMFGQYLHYTDKMKKAYFGDIERYLEQKQHSNIEIKQINPSIEDCFMKLMTHYE